MYLSVGSSGPVLRSHCFPEILMAVTWQSRWQSGWTGRYECTHYSVVRDNRNVNLGRQLSVLGGTLRCLSSGAARRGGGVARAKNSLPRLLTRSLERMIKRGSIYRLSALRPERKSPRLVCRYTLDPRFISRTSTRCPKPILIFDLSTELKF